MGIPVTRRGSIIVSMLVTLSSCTSLPRSGPDHTDIDRAAAIKVTTPERKVGIDYVLIDLNKGMLPYFDKIPSSTLRSGFGGGRGGAPDIPLGMGDVVQASIFEAQAGGLFIPADAGSRPGNFISLPQQTIDKAGTISIPYAGRVPAAGRMKEDVEQDIEDKLASRAIEPQVVLTTITSRSSQVAVVGDVNNPQKIILSAAGDRVLDAISEAGGLSTPNLETNVTLQRRGKTATVAYETLLKNPSENIYLAPGDTVSVEHERRTFIALGASGINNRIDFEDSNLTLGEAMAKAGGLIDSRADPREVVVYRKVSRNTLQRLNIDTSRFKDDEVPVIFRANLRDPATLFAIQEFRMADKDVMYISNAHSVELVKFLDILNSVSSTISGVSNDTTDTREAVRDLGN
ncbi:UNVERIFIED_ORG: polysaccharide export outer membrane protein [Rhizobium sophorae]|uniref:polysaccharide biosynthesis/export family protein n=1 Tax=Rhizobium leguminosarum TaxID=384 RepID=UPI000DE56F98|nr:polysaccharide biosynthesis/export family protein [Rhizobium leguminosarum]MBB4526539.1 polysaccharide export outer membrane protein [Rhizobium leguminosarum]MDH6663664.1 polysaccharide export outer membrane protein [Rhizobium sophorae]